MDSKSFRKIYLAPLDISCPKSKPPRTDNIRSLLLPESCFYSSNPPHRQQDALTIDLLTKVELIELIEAMGAGDRKHLTGGDLTDWSRKKAEYISQLESEIASRGQRIAELERTLFAIHSGRAWRIYKFSRPILRSLGQVLKLAGRVRRGEPR